MISRMLVVALVACALIWVPFAGICSNVAGVEGNPERSEGAATSGRDASSSLTLEQEWSNAMVYTDELPKEGIAYITGSILATVAAVYIFAVGVEMIFPLKADALARSVFGFGLCALTGGISLSVLRYSVYAGIFVAPSLIYRVQLAQLGRRQGWTRQQGLVGLDHPGEDVLIKPDGSVLDYLDLIRAGVGIDH